MSYRFDDELDQIVMDYTTKDGGMGLQTISMDVLASRMALLGVDDPGLALAALAAEIDVEGGKEPYTPLVSAIATVPPITPDLVPQPRTMRMMGLEPPVQGVSAAQIVAALDADPSVQEARAVAYSRLPMTFAPDSGADAQFKESLREGRLGDLLSLRDEHLGRMAPTVVDSRG